MLHRQTRRAVVTRWAPARRANRPNDAIGVVHVSALVEPSVVWEPRPPKSGRKAFPLSHPRLNDTLNITLQRCVWELRIV